MSADMDDCELRNEEGYPRAFVTGGPAPMTTSIKQSTDNSNRALPWLSAVLAGFAAGGVLVICLLKPWEASAERAKAEVLAEVSQDVADARAESKAAGTDAAIWKNRVMKLEAQADAKR